MALQLKKKTAAKKSVSSAKTSSDLDGAKDAATRYQDLAIEADEIKAQMAVAREEVMEVVDPWRDASIRGGTDVASCDIPTENGKRVKIVWTERYRALDGENKDALQEAFGSSYALFVEEVESVSLRADVTLEQVEQAIGKKAMAALQGLLEVKSGLAPRKGARKEVATLFGSGNSEMAEDLLTFVDACSISPQMRAK